MTQEKISPLRARMIKDMRIRGLAETSQKAHIRAMKDLTAFLGRSNRPTPVVHSDQETRAIGASRIRCVSNTGQILRRNVEAAACTLQTNAFVAVTKPAERTLSP